MHKLLMGIFCWLLAGSNSFAQQNDSLSAFKKNEWQVKFSPLAIFETDGGLSFSGEYIVPKLRLGFQLETQFVLFDVYKNDDNNGFESPEGVVRSGMPRGIELRPEVRYYVEGLRPKIYHYSSKRPPSSRMIRRMQRLPERIYLAIDFLYKNIRRERLGDLDISNGSSMPVFRQRALYKDVKEIMGFDGKIGFINPLSEDEHWLVEAYLGLGIRYKKFSYLNLPIGASEPLRRTIGFPRSTFNDPTTVESFPSFPAGIKFIYRW